MAIYNKIFWRLADNKIFPASYTGDRGQVLYVQGLQEPAEEGACYVLQVNAGGICRSVELLFGDTQGPRAALPDAVFSAVGPAEVYLVHRQGDNVQNTLLKSVMEIQERPAVPLDALEL